MMQDRAAPSYLRIEGLEEELREVLDHHGLRLVESTYRRNHTARTTAISLKASGDLDVQEDLPFPDLDR